MNIRNVGQKIINLRENKNLSQRELARRVDLNASVMNRIESGERPIKDFELDKIASALDTTTDFLLGRTDNPEPFNKELPELTNKDEKDIAKDLENIINNISTDGYAHFDGRSMEDLDEDDKELLKASLENSMRLAKRLAKDKFTPKKYKKE